MYVTSITMLPFYIVAIRIDELVPSVHMRIYTSSWKNVTIGSLFFSMLLWIKLIIFNLIENFMDRRIQNNFCVHTMNLALAVVLNLSMTSEFDLLKSMDHLIIHEKLGYQKAIDLRSIELTLFKEDIYVLVGTSASISMGTMRKGRPVVLITYIQYFYFYCAK